MLIITHKLSSSLVLVSNIAICKSNDVNKKIVIRDGKCIAVQFHCDLQWGQSLAASP